MEKVERECGPGWFPLVDMLEQQAAKVCAKLVQVKEKFGGLRVYYTLPDVEEDVVALNEFVDAVDQAEIDSVHVCELCGHRGQTMAKGGWLKTLCKSHAAELGYVNKA